MTEPYTLYLMRHGEAAWTSPDPERALTERGREANRRVLDKLLATAPQIDRILVSPYRRARQTAAEAEQRLEMVAQQHDCLTPDESPSATLEALTPHVARQTLVVAHQPLLGYLASLLDRGDLKEPHPFATSEILILELEAWAPACGRIIRSLQP